MNCQGLGMSPQGTSISAGSFAAEAFSSALPQRLRAGDAVAGDAEAFGQPDEVRIGEVGADQRGCRAGRFCMLRTLP